MHTIPDRVTASGAGELTLMCCLEGAARTTVFTAELFLSQAGLRAAFKAMGKGLRPHPGWDWSRREAKEFSPAPSSGVLSHIHSGSGWMGGLLVYHFQGRLFSFPGFLKSIEQTWPFKPQMSPVRAIPGTGTTPLAYWGG